MSHICNNCVFVYCILVSRSAPPADQVSCIVTQTASLLLDEASPLNNSIEASYSTTDVTSLRNNTIISTVPSPTKKKRRTRKKNVAIASIQELSHMTMEPVQLMDIGAVCLTNVISTTSNSTVLANPPKSRARKSGTKPSNCDSGWVSDTSRSPSKSKNPKRDLNSIHRKLENAQSNLSPSKQVCILYRVDLHLCCVKFFPKLMH